MVRAASSRLRLGSNDVARLALDCPRRRRSCRRYFRSGALTPEGSMMTGCPDTDPLAVPMSCHDLARALELVKVRMLDGFVIFVEGADREYALNGG